MTVTIALGLLIGLAGTYLYALWRESTRHR
jgi:hypothetical protein